MKPPLADPRLGEVFWLLFAMTLVGALSAEVVA